MNNDWEWRPTKTGYENATISIELVSNIQEYLSVIGECEKCHTISSPNWYIRKWLNNEMIDYQGICENCKENL